MRIDFRSFEREDWFAFAGAEGDAQIAYPTSDSCVVVSDTGLDVFLDAKGENFGFMLDAKCMTPKGVNALLANVCWSGFDVASVELVSLGFEALGPC